jgi:MoxR-like ATPase
MLQLRSTIRIRHGIMLVGEAGTGKTELYRIVAKALEANLTVIYPKAVSIDELFGSFNDLTR